MDKSLQVELIASIGYLYEGGGTRFHSSVPMHLREAVVDVANAINPRRAWTWTINFPPPRDVFYDLLRSQRGDVGCAIEQKLKLIADAMRMACLSNEAIQRIRDFVDSLNLGLGVRGLIANFSLVTRADGYRQSYGASIDIVVSRGDGYMINNRLPDYSIFATTGSIYTLYECQSRIKAFKTLDELLVDLRHTISYIN